MKTAQHSEGMSWRMILFMVLCAAGIALLFTLPISSSSMIFLVILLICPLSMLYMMWRSGRDRGGSHGHTSSAGKGENKETDSGGEGQ